MTSYELLYSKLKNSLELSALVPNSEVLTAYPESFSTLPIVVIDQYQSESKSAFDSMNHMNYFKVEIFSSSKSLNIDIADVVSRTLFSEFIEGTAMDLDDGSIKHKVMYFNRLN